jgi:hypothetical protein
VDGTKSYATDDTLSTKRFDRAYLTEHESNVNRVANGGMRQKKHLGKARYSLCPMEVK